jgi:hypothetical protein
MFTVSSLLVYYLIMMSAVQNEVKRRKHMDVFELVEDKAAREQAEKQARWNKEVKAAQAKDTTKCCATVYSSSSYTWGSSCTNTAKFHREERLTWEKESPLVTRHYCGTHDPVSSKERQNKKYAIEKQQRDAKWAREDRARNRQCLVNRVVGHLTDEQLVELEKFLPSTQFAKAVQS